MSSQAVGCSISMMLPHTSILLKKTRNITGSYKVRMIENINVQTSVSAFFFCQPRDDLGGSEHQSVFFFVRLSNDLTILYESFF